MASSGSSLGTATFGTDSVMVAAPVPDGAHSSITSESDASGVGGSKVYYSLAPSEISARDVPITPRVDISPVTRVIVGSGGNRAGPTAPGAPTVPPIIGLGTSTTGSPTTGLEPIPVPLGTPSGSPVGTPRQRSRSAGGRRTPNVDEVAPPAAFVSPRSNTSHRGPATGGGNSARGVSPRAIPSTALGSGARSGQSFRPDAASRSGPSSAPQSEIELLQARASLAAAESSYAATIRQNRENIALLSLRLEEQTERADGLTLVLQTAEQEAYGYGRKIDELKAKVIASAEDADVAMGHFKQGSEQQAIEYAKIAQTSKDQFEQQLRAQNDETIVLKHHLKALQARLGQGETMYASLSNEQLLRLMLFDMKSSSVPTESTSLTGSWNLLGKMSLTAATARECPKTRHTARSWLKGLNLSSEKQLSVPAFVVTKNNIPN
jgi:hypothetical protein